MLRAHSASAKRERNLALPVALEAELINMGKVLALDIGKKRIGYAVSDPEHKIAFPRKALKFNTWETLAHQLQSILGEEEISLIVIGLPLDEENQDTATALEIRALGQKIARRFMLPVEYVDEFGSTKEALSKIPFRKDRRKKAGYADAVSAQIILERYLEGDYG